MLILQEKTMTATLSGYQLLETLHSGSKTVIYRGRRETDNVFVIIKILLCEHPPLPRGLFF